MSAALLPASADPTTAELLAARPHLSMHARDGLLIENIPAQSIAAECGTPTWVVSAGALRTRLHRLQAALSDLPLKIHYAVKANDHLAILHLMAQNGAGADVVSGGELLRALHAGHDPAHIVFSGVGKQDWELTLALERDIGQINVESAEELATLSALATAMGKTATIALRINPDIDAGTHAKITTGRADNKFGIGIADAVSLYAHAAGLPGIDAAGIALHIGSQILSMAPFHAAYRRAADLVRTLRAQGNQVRIVDCGGGLGIDYRDDPAPLPEAFAATIRQAFADLDVRLAIEPGRWLAAPAGLLLSNVILSKTTANRRFVVLDAAMNDLIRPAMYESWHAIVPVSPTDAIAPTTPCDIVGPVCETGDTFAKSRALPPLAPHATVAILDAGAYGSVMSSTYNARPFAAQVLVDGDRWALIRDRQPLESLWANERIPNWLT